MKSKLQILFFALFVVQLAGAANGFTIEPPCKKAAPVLTADDGKPLWFTTPQLLVQASYCETPIYPPGILYEGTVTISVLVDEKGEVPCAKAVDGPPEVVAAALDAARKWKFKPMTQGGRSAAFYGTLNFHFSSVSTALKSKSCLGVEPPLDVTMVQLIADPVRFDRRLIRVIGFLRLEFEGNVLYLHREDNEHAILGDGIWVDVTSEIKQQSTTLNMNYVLLEGVFSSGDRGHMDMCSGAIKKVSRAEVWPFHPHPNRENTR